MIPRMIRLADCGWLIIKWVQTHDNALQNRQHFGYRSTVNFRKSIPAPYLRALFYSIKTTELVTLKAWSSMGLHFLE